MGGLVLTGGQQIAGPVERLFGATRYEVSSFAEVTSGHARPSGCEWLDAPRKAAGHGAATPSPVIIVGKNWGWRRRPLGMTGRKVGRTSGFRAAPLTSHGPRRNLGRVRRDEPAEPQARTERCERGKPKGKPQGGPREAEGTLQGGIKGRRRAPQGGRNRSGLVDPICDGPWCATVASLESPRPARAGVVRHDPGAVPAAHH